MNNVKIIVVAQSGNDCSNRENGKNLTKSLHRTRGVKNDNNFLWMINGINVPRFKTSIEIDWTLLKVLETPKSNQVKIS